ncbi:fibronectin type III domain-containing protein [archaeon]|nr:fibronectin type III domain-containing protein [archaeon]
MKNSKLALVLVFVFFFSLSVQAQRLRVQPASIVASKGLDFDVNIASEGISNLYGFQFDLQFDSSVISFNNAKFSNVLGLPSQVFCTDSSIWQVSAGLVSNLACVRTIAGGITANGVLATLTFHADKNSYSALKLVNAQLSNNSGQSISFTDSNGLVSTCGHAIACFVVNDCSVGQSCLYPGTCSASCLDINAPAVPSNFRSTSKDSNSVSLAWNASLESDLNSYRIYKDGALQAKVNKPATTYTVTGLASNTDYNFQISALDNVGNESDLSQKLPVKIDPITCILPQISCNETCVIPTCTSDSQCNDSNPNTTDTCLNAGTCTSMCSNINVVLCGNGTVDSGENCSTCPADAGCAAGQFCCSTACQDTGCGGGGGDSGGGGGSGGGSGSGGGGGGGGSGGHGPSTPCTVKVSDLDGDCVLRDSDCDDSNVSVGECKGCLVCSNKKCVEGLKCNAPGIDVNKKNWHQSLNLDYKTILDVNGVQIVSLKDPSGAVIKGAILTLSKPDGSNVTLYPNENGEFVFPVEKAGSFSFLLSEEGYFFEGAFSVRNSTVNVLPGVKVDTKKLERLTGPEATVNSLYLYLLIVSFIVILGASIVQARYAFKGSKLWCVKVILYSVAFAFAPIVASKLYGMVFAIPVIAVQLAALIIVGFLVRKKFLETGAFWKG